MNKKYTKKDITDMLNGYPDVKRKIKQLEFEMKIHKPIISGDEMIETLALNSSLNESGIHSNKTSDKTPDIAISYVEKANEINRKSHEKYARELLALITHLQRIEYYIDILSKNHSNVLKLLYIEELTYEEAAEQLNMSLSAINNNRCAGIKKLVQMYNVIEEENNEN